MALPPLSYYSLPSEEKTSLTIGQWTAL